MHIALVRGSFLNPWEMQNFAPLGKRHEVVAFGGKRMLGIPRDTEVKQLWSPMDLPDFPGKMSLLNRLFIDAHYLFGLERQLRGFDIAHCAETYYHYTQQCLNAKKRGWVKSVVSTVWETIPFNNESIRGKKKFKKRSIREVDLFITPSKRAEKALIKEGCDPKKIKIIRMGVNLSKFKVKSEKLKFDKREKSLKILFVGRMVEEKGVWELLEAFRRLVKNNELRIKNHELRMIGSGSQASRLKKKIREWGLKRYVSIERQRYEDMPIVYQQADIFVLPSKYTKTWEEQYGMVLVEAMASGLPIVATRSGAIPEVVGDAALLINTASEQTLYAAFLKLIDNKELRFSLSVKARKRVEREFDMQKSAEKIERVYFNLFD